MTRLVAITPSLIVSIIGGSAAAGKLIIIASVSDIILSDWQNSKWHKILKNIIDI